MSDDNQKEPEIRKLLEVSTAHITKETSEWIDKRLKSSDFLITPVTYPKSEYGWFIWVPAKDNHFDETIKDYILAGTPADLIMAMIAAANLGCSMISLDCDGPKYSFLPEYDWETDKRIGG